MTSSRERFQIVILCSRSTPTAVDYLIYFTDKGSIPANRDEGGDYRPLEYRERALDSCIKVRFCILIVVFLFLHCLPDGEKKRSMPTIPTISYTVGDRDTLTSVAARFDTTPSELTQLNRLASSFIYSGQQLLVPDKKGKGGGSGEGGADSDASTERSSPEGRRRGADSQEDLCQDEKG